MFVITRSLGKFSGDRRLSDSDMPLAKAQRRQVRREKTNILTKDFHVLSPTIAALASLRRRSGHALREIFRVSVTVVRRRRTSFSQRSLGKSVYYYRLKLRHYPLSDLPSLLRNMPTLWLAVRLRASVSFALGVDAGSACLIPFHRVLTPSLDRVKKWYHRK